MIFFLILPIWLAVVVFGLGLLLFRVTRPFAAYVIVPPTLAVLFSFVASLLGLVGGAHLGAAIGADDYSGLMALGGYGLGLLGGGAFGGLLGLAMVGFIHYCIVSKRRRATAAV